MSFQFWSSKSKAGSTNRAVFLFPCAPPAKLHVSKWWWGGGVNGQFGELSHSQQLHLHISCVHRDSQGVEDAEFVLFRYVIDLFGKRIYYGKIYEGQNLLTNGISVFGCLLLNPWRAVYFAEPWNPLFLVNVLILWTYLTPCKKAVTVKWRGVQKYFPLLSLWEQIWK